MALLLFLLPPLNDASLPGPGFHTLCSIWCLVLSDGGCLLLCGSFSPSLCLCRFDSKNRELSSAGQNPQVAYHVTPPPADWDCCCFVSAAALSPQLFCLYHIYAQLCLSCCFVTAAAWSLLLLLCMMLSPIRRALSLAVTDSLLPFPLALCCLVALLSSGILLQSACVEHCWHCTFNLVTFVILTKWLWKVNPLFLYYLFCFLYFCLD